MADDNAYEYTGQASTTGETLANTDSPGSKPFSIHHEGLNTGKPSLFALLVGINDYSNLKINDASVAFMSLRGCVNDAFKLKAYLEQQADFDVNIKMILDADADKHSIIEAMSVHLSKAGPGDVAFFYFSGHGTQEYADKAWDKANNGKLESLVCAPGHNKNDFLIANKELRYLIRNLAAKGPHIVTVFDCCHSGENTRSHLSDNSGTPILIEKKLPYVFPKRSWDQFVFADEISAEDVAQNGEAAVIPEGAHIQISACESHQSAVEVAGEGVFTKALLNVLQSTRGRITYYGLRSRVRQYLRTIYQQTPKIYIAADRESGLYNGFLNRNLARDQYFAEAVYNDRSGWLLNRGAIHGLDSRYKTIPLLDPFDKSIACVADIEAIKNDYTELTPTAVLNEATTYLADIEDMLLQQLRVYPAWLQQTKKLAADSYTKAGETLTGDVLLLNNLLEAIQGNPDVIQTIDDAPAADYYIQVLNKWIYITAPNDTYTPLSYPVRLNDPESSGIIIKQLRHLAKWQFIKNLLNQAGNIKLSAEAIGLEVSAFVGGKEVLLHGIKDEFTIGFENTNNGWEAAFKITLTNKLDSTLYCCMPYLSMCFGSEPDLVQPIVYKMEPGIPIVLPQQVRPAGSYKNDKCFVKHLSDATYYYNKTTQTEYLKIIFSTEDFDGSGFMLEELPSPVTPRSEGNQRSVSGLASSERIIGKAWSTKLITLKFPNPLHNSIDGRDLAAMLQNRETTDFAVALYFDVNKTEQGAFNCTIKPGIRLLKERPWLIGITEKELTELAEQQLNKDIHQPHLFII